ncbi:MAG: sugar phosphate isomerase/epimerase [Clostridia bacterium]|nr:sugar phosphate isomerase/epimerase [Clostridia bacterium]
MKLCFSTLGCSDYSLDGIITLAKNYGIEYLEVRGINGTLENKDIAEFLPENAEKTKKALSDAKISPRVLGASLAFHDPGKYRDCIEAAKTDILIAERMGFPYVRFFGNSIKDDRDACIACVTSSFAELADFAEAHGMTALLEVHGDFNTIENLTPVVDALRGKEGFGIIWDIAHSDIVYGENWQPFYELIRPFIKHVHLKDHKDGALTLPGDGTIPIVPIVKRLIADGYDGCFSLEWEKKWHPEIGDIEPALDKLTDILSKI